MVIPFISGFFRVSSRGFHLTHRALTTAVGSWAAVEPNGMGLPSRFSPPRLGALLPSPRRLQQINNPKKTLINFTAPLYLNGEELHDI